MFQDDRYPILETPKALIDYFKLKDNIKKRTIDSNTKTPKEVDTSFYTNLNCEEVYEILRTSSGENGVQWPTPVITSFLSYIDYPEQNTRSTIFIPELKIDVITSNIELEQAKLDGAYLSEDINKAIQRNPNLRGTVAGCSVRRIQPLGFAINKYKEFEFFYRIHLDCKFS